MSVKEYIGPSKEAAEYMSRSNPYLEEGYRINYKTAEKCVASIFAWHNETLNIWSHLLSTLFFAFLFWETQFEDPHGVIGLVHGLDRTFVGMATLSAIGTFLFSTIFHTFSCISESCLDTLLVCDLVGVFLIILSFFFSGLYFGFYFHPQLCLFYMCAVLVFSAIAVLSVVLPSWREHRLFRTFIFSSFAAFGFVPMIHWVLLRPALEISIFLPKLLSMYLFAGVGLFFFISHFPERLFPSSRIIAFFFNSHALWHIAVSCSAFQMHCVAHDYILYLQNSIQPQTII